MPGAYGLRLVAWARPAEPIGKGRGALAMEPRGVYHGKRLNVSSRPRRMDLELIVDPECREDPRTEEILLRFEKGGLSSKDVSIRLRRHRGRFLKPCPGTRNYICCGYFVLNVILGCPFGCEYCILRAYLKTDRIQLMMNVEDALHEAAQFTERARGVVRIGTGELGDSLALEGIFPVSHLLVDFFSTLPKAMLELKTKSCEVQGLLDLEHRSHTVISFSLSPGEIASKAEAGAPPPLERLRAGALCQEKGYPVGIHLDPIVIFEGWEEAYRDLLERTFQLLNPERVLWVSMGALRYPAEMHGQMVEARLGLEEMVPGLDGKMRYLRPIRTRMFKILGRWIRELSRGKPLLYLCMESEDVWKDSLGFAPEGMVHLDRMFQERIKEFWRREGLGNW